MAWSPVAATYTSHLELSGDDRVIDGPTTASFDEVIAWALRVARTAYVRPHWQCDQIFVAGIREPDSGNPPLDVSRSREPAQVLPDYEGTSAGVVANCGSCDWSGTYADSAALLQGYTEHSQRAHGDPRDREDPR